MPSEFVTTEVATVYRFGGRRYFTKHAAFKAKAREWMQRDHNETLTGDFECECLYCRDRYTGSYGMGRIHRRLTRYLMRKAS